MCGIFGAIEWDRRLEVERVIRATDALMHRGPDESGFLFDGVRPSAVPGRACRFLKEEQAWQIGLGHRRLSILDLSCGQQPMLDSSGEWAIVFNGEIYNHLEIRRELAAAGQRFLTDHSDTETLLSAFAYWGVGALARLNGMFAAAIYHRETGRLWLVRDRFGKKPIYLWHGHDRMVFASELKAIISYLGETPAMDLDALGDYMMRGCIHAPRSIYRGIVKVPAASVLAFDLSAKGGRLVSQDRYWELRPLATNGARAEHSWLEQTETLLNDAVKIRLLSDVPVGAFLSSGLDSATVCALAAKHVGEPLRAFTIGSDDAASDETEGAAEVASLLGLRHVVEKCRLDPASLLPELVTAFDEPFSDLSMIPTHQVSKLARREVKVVLTGDGADEFFCGYGIFREMTELRALERVPLLAQGGYALARGWPFGAPGGGFLSRSFRGRGFPRYQGWIEEPRMLGLLNRDVAVKMDPGWPYLRQLWEDSKALDPLARISLLQGSTYLTDDILVKVDRATMAHSVEARSPFLDYRVVELAANMPPSLKLRDGRGKWVLRKMAERWFPRAYLDRPKRGFTMPLKAWMQRELSDDLDQLSRCSLLDSARVKRLVERQRKSHRDYSPTLWRLIVLQRWLRRGQETQRT